MKFHLIAFDSIVDAVLVNARTRFSKSTDVDMSSSKLINDVNGVYQKELSKFISQDDICVHTLRFGLDLYNRLKQTSTDTFCWKEMEDKTSSTDFVMCSLLEKSVFNFLPNLQKLYNRVHDATDSDEDVPMHYIKIMRSIPNDNHYFTDNGKISKLSDRKQLSTASQNNPESSSDSNTFTHTSVFVLRNASDTNVFNQRNTTSTTSSVAHTSQSTQRDVNVSSTSDNTTTSILPNPEVFNQTNTANTTSSVAHTSQSTQRDVNVSSTSDNTTTSIVPYREVNPNNLSENVTVTHTSEEDLPNKHFTVSGFGVTDMKVSLMIRSNKRLSTTLEERKLVKLQKRKQKEKKANIVSTLVRLGHLNFRLADGNCAVLCSTTNTAVMGSVIIETKNNNDSNAPMDTKYKFIIKFQRKQADLVVPFTLLQQIIQRNGSNERPYISLPLFQQSHSLSEFARFHNNQVSTNGNHNHTTRRSRRSYDRRNNTSNESQPKRMKRNNRYNK